ncbi:MAG: SDR family NAD(P)-dependent oxidoreductase [Actinobacteria bacterium]|nr:SDR family NAD(P)-dependent oxidoreductase [Actinomycetota bacterium]
MKDLHGKVAVVTGGASGVGRAMGERFAREGMHVVLADVERPVLDATVDELKADGIEVTGIATDVSDLASVERLRDQTLERFGKVHLLCNNAGVGAGAEGHIWDHTINDWTWALDVNVYGVINGIVAFVPSMLDHGEEGHVVNTSSGNGGVSPLPGTPIYATTKAAVVTISECLYAQLQSVGAEIGASVLFPGPKMLRTGLFSSWRNRPPELANPTPRKTPPTTIESFEKRMADAGIAVDYTPVEEVAGRVVDAVKARQFWILPESDRSDAQINARAASMLARSNPDYLRDLTG